MTRELYICKASSHNVALLPYSLLNFLQLYFFSIPLPMLATLFLNKLYYISFLKFPSPVFCHVFWFSDFFGFKRNGTCQQHRGPSGIKGIYHVSQYLPLLQCGQIVDFLPLLATHLTKILAPSFSSSMCFPK